MTDKQWSLQPLLLIVDDSPEVGLIIERYGKRYGHRVVISQDTKKARSYLESSPLLPDLVLLDINLPGESGIELCRQLKATPELARIPIALFSHGELTQELSEGLEAGADFVVSKDLLRQPEAWAERLEEILRPADSRLPVLSLSCQGLSEGCRSAAARVAAVNAVMRHTDLPQLEPPVLTTLFRRALKKVASSESKVRLLENGLGFDPELAVWTDDPELVAACAAALAEQIWCLLGTAASAPIRKALADAVATHSEPGVT